MHSRPMNKVKMFVCNKEYEKRKWASIGSQLKMEYTREACTEGVCISVALCLKDHIVFAYGKQLVREHPNHTMKCIKPLDIHISASYIGVENDVDLILEEAKRKCQKARMLEGKKMPVFRLAETIASDNFRNAAIATWDPKIALILVGGFDKKTPHVYEVSPSGFFTEKIIGVIGNNALVATKYLEEHFGAFVNQNVLVGIEYVIRGISLAMENVGIFEVGVLKRGEPILMLNAIEKMCCITEYCENIKTEVFD